MTIVRRPDSFSCAREWEEYRNDLYMREYRSSVLEAVTHARSRFKLPNTFEDLLSLADLHALNVLMPRCPAGPDVRAWFFFRTLYALVDKVRSETHYRASRCVIYLPPGHPWLLRRVHGDYAACDEMDFVQDRLRSVSDAARQTVLLRLAGHTTKQIADQLNLHGRKPERTARALLTAGMRALVPAE